MLPFLSFFEELDFGDEPPPPEPRGRRRRLPRPPRGPGGRPTGPQLQRLIALAVIVVAVIVGIVYGVRHYQHNAEVRSYKSFVRNANAVAKSSDSVGSQFTKALLASDQTPSGLVKALDSEAQQQRQVVTDATKLDGPGGLGQVEPFLVQSMQYRFAGLAGMRDALHQAFAHVSSKNRKLGSDAVVAVALMYARLVSSDVVYQDSYQSPAMAVLKQKHITGVSVDDSSFIPPSLLGYVDPQGMKDRLATIVLNATSNTGKTGGSTTGKLRGMALGSVTVSPGGQTLSASKTNVVKVSGSSAFVVSVKNSGDVLETSIAVDVYINSKALGQQKITQLAPGKVAQISFPIGTPPLQGTQVVKAEVHPVPHEALTSNNSGSYKVLFELGS